MIHFVTKLKFLVEGIQTNVHKRPTRTRHIIIDSDVEERVIEEEEDPMPQPVEEMVVEEVAEDLIPQSKSSGFLFFKSNNLKLLRQK